MALLLITHDLAVVAETADRVVVMYAGQVMETGPVPAMFDAPRHPYTQALLDALPEHNRRSRAPAHDPGVVPGARDRPAGCLLAPRCASCRRALPAERPALARRACRRALPFPLDAGQALPHDRVPAGMRMRLDRTWARRCSKHAISRATIAFAPGTCARTRSCARSTACRSRCTQGRTLAVVGESGCGKSTLARQVTMVETPTSGRLLLDGCDVARADAAARRQLRPQVQMVFQNPYASLNPRRTVGALLEEPLVIQRRGSRAERRDAALRDDGEGRPAARALRALSAHVLGRPAAAHRRGARADARIRGSSSPTSRFPRSTSRSRRRC